MSEWNQAKLGEVITLKRGYDLPNTKRVFGEYPVVSSSGISDFHQSFKVKAPGVVTGRYGTIGQVYYVENDFWPLNTTLYVEDFKGNNPRFISYFLQTLDYQAFAAKSAVPGINRNDLHLAMVKVPDNDTQLKISDVLSVYDDLIENNNRRITILEEMAQRLYREWFVHFRFPGYKNVKLVNSELGMIPEGWEVSPVKRYISLQSGFAFKSTNFSDDGIYKVITIKNVQDGHFTDSNCKNTSIIPSALPQHCYLYSGDIIMSLTGNVGRVCLVFGDNMLLNQRVCKITSQYNSFSYCLFRSESMFEKMNSIANGVAQQNLSPIETEKIKVIFPTNKHLLSFENLCSPLFREMTILNIKNSNLRKTRDHLLPRIISGDVDVSKIEL